MLLPVSWQPDPVLSSPPYLVYFRGPGHAQFIVHSVAAAGKSLADLTAQVKTAILGALGIGPERTEKITMGGVAAVLLTYHGPDFISGDASDYALYVVCLSPGGRGFELDYADPSGQESQDRAFVLAVVASLEFIGPAR